MLPLGLLDLRCVFAVLVAASGCEACLWELLALGLLAVVYFVGCFLGWGWLDTLCLLLWLITLVLVAWLCVVVYSCVCGCWGCLYGFWFGLFGLLLGIDCGGLTMDLWFVIGLVCIVAAFGFPAVVFNSVVAFLSFRPGL